MFSKQHYNAIAKDIREEFSRGLAFDTKSTRLTYTNALVNLALKFARRFEADNSSFDPVGFLNACSPNIDLYPLGELYAT